MFKLLTSEDDFTDMEYKRKQAILEEEGRIIRMKLSVEKLHAIYNLWLALNPEHKAIAKQCMEDAKDAGQNAANKFGASKDPNSGLRRAFMMPSALLRTIDAFETEFMKGKDGKKDLAILKKAFPQFMASEVF